MFPLIFTDDPRHDHLDAETRQSSSLFEPPSQPAPRLLTRHQLRALVPYSPQHILRLEKQGRFPRRVRIGANRVAWLASEVEAWIAERVGRRDGSFVAIESVNTAPSATVVDLRRRPRRAAIR